MEQAFESSEIIVVVKENPVVMQTVQGEPQSQTPERRHCLPHFYGSWREFSTLARLATDYLWKTNRYLYLSDILFRLKNSIIQ